MTPGKQGFLDTQDCCAHELTDVAARTEQHRSKPDGVPKGEVK